MEQAVAAAALAGLVGGTFVGMDTLTNVPLKGGKKNPMKDRVTKLTVGAQVMCFSNTRNNAYEAMVKRRLEAEGKDPASFELGERAWGERIPNTSFVRHVKDGVEKLYLEVIFLKSGKSQYFLDGKPIEKVAIEGLEEREATGQGGLENQVVIRTFALDSVVALRANGQEWV